MSEFNLKKFEFIKNILRDDWENVVKSEIFDISLEDMLDNKKLHSETTENIKKTTSHFFSESEQARILNYKTKIGKNIYHDVFKEKQNKIEREVSKLKRIRDALKKERDSLKFEISRLESDVCLIEKTDVDMA